MNIWFRDHKQAFNDAIANGYLSEYPNDPNYAGNYMYMCSVDIQDEFKHIDTRQSFFTEYDSGIDQNGIWVTAA